MRESLSHLAAVQESPDSASDNPVVTVMLDSCSFPSYSAAKFGLHAMKAEPEGRESNRKTSSKMGFENERGSSQGRPRNQTADKMGIGNSLRAQQLDPKALVPELIRHISDMEWKPFCFRGPIPISRMKKKGLATWQFQNDPS